MLAALFALSAALIHGVSDFAGGLAARRAPALAVTMTAYLVGTTGVILASLVLPGNWTLAAVGFGAGCGVVASVGSLCLFAALARGPVAVVSPLIAIVFAAIPVAVGVANGERLGLGGGIGIGLGLLAVFALSVDTRRPDPDKRPASRQPLGIVAAFLAVAAGVFFAVGTVLLDLAPAGAGVVPAVGEMLAGSFSLLALSGLRRALPGAAPREVSAAGLAWRGRTGGIAILSGVTLAVANSFTVLALQAGELAVVATLLALYPLSTVVLAASVLRERITVVHGAGIALALGAAVLLGGPPG